VRPPQPAGGLLLLAGGAQRSTMKLRLSPNPYTVFFGDKRSETLDANATSHLTELQVHQKNVSKLEIILLACFTMLLVLGFLLLAMYVVRCIQNGSEKYKNMSKSRKEKKEQKEQSWEEQITVFVEDTAMADSMRQILRELLGMGWVVPFSVVCGILAGIQSLWKQEAEPGNPSAGFVCGPLNLQNDTGLKYVGTLLSFLILFRFNQLYGRVVTARGHIEGTVSALKIIAVHVRGMGQPHIDQWVKKEHLRVQLSHRLVYVYAMLVFTLRGNGMPKSKQALAQIDRLRDKKSKDSLIGFDKTIVSQLKCALLEETALLDTDFQDLVDANLINGSPAQYGQLIGVTSQLIASMSQTEGCIDIFPGMTPYPRLITFMGRLVLIYFCGCAASVVGCNTPFKDFFVAQVYSFFITLAYCGLFILSSNMENPYGFDLMDFTLDHYGVALAFDIAKILQVPPQSYPYFPVTDERYPELRNRPPPQSTAGLAETLETRDLIRSGKWAPAVTEPLAAISTGANARRP